MIPSPHLYRKSMSRAGLCYFLLLCTVTAAQTIFTAFTLPYLEAPWFMGTASIVCNYLAGAPLLWLYSRLLCQRGSAPARGQALSPKTFGLLVLVTLGVAYTANFATLGIVQLLNAVRGESLANPLDTLVAGGSWVTWLAMCVFAPVFEEIMFRKTLYHCIGRWGTGIYMVVGGLVFGLFHLNLHQFLYAACLGAVFCYVYARTGRLWYTIALHAVMNLVGGPVALWASQHPATEQAMSMFIFICMVSGVCVLFAYMRGSISVPSCALPAHPVARALASWGMLAYVLLAAVMIFLFTFPELLGGVTNSAAAAQGMV